MNDQEQNITVAGVFGISREDYLRGYELSQFGEPYPNYGSDLNAMHEAWLTLELYDRNVFTGELIGVVQREPGAGTLDAINATAKQRREAFLRTLNLYIE